MPCLAFPARFWSPRPTSENTVVILLRTTCVATYAVSTACFFERVYPSQRPSLISSFARLVGSASSHGHRTCKKVNGMSLWYYKNGSIAATWQAGCLHGDVSSQSSCMIPLLLSFSRNRCVGHSGPWSFPARVRRDEVLESPIVWTLHTLVGTRGFLHVDMAPWAFS